MNKFFITFCLSLIIITLWAKPAPYILRDFNQPDGTSLRAYVRGDEFTQWFETTDGYTLLQDTDGWFRYAEKNKAGDLVPSSIAYNKPSLHNSPNSLSSISHIPKNLFFSKAQLDSKAFKRNPVKSEQTTVPSVGKIKLLAISLKFNDALPRNYTVESLSNMLNTDPLGFRSYYKEASYDKLDIESTVYEIDINTPFRNFVDSCEQQQDNISMLIITIYDQLHDQGVDLNEFDSNKDGILDAIAIFHTARESQAVGKMDGIMTHMNNLIYRDDYQLKCGLKMGSYCIQSQYLANTNENEEIGSICHEFGHILGAPDYYDTRDGNPGIGSWDLMATGCNNGASAGRFPAHPNAYQKMLYGWIDLIELEEATEISGMQPLALAPQAYAISYKDTCEFFLLENRQQIKFDRDIPGSGLLIYRVDHSLIHDSIDMNTINVPSDRGLGMEVIQANIDEPQFAPFKDDEKFTPDTDPAMVDKDGNPVNKPIYNIIEYDGLVKFSFLQPAGIIPSKAPATFDVRIKSGECIITGDDLTGKSIKMYDLSGACLYQSIGTSNTVIIQVNNGFYILQVDNTSVKVAVQ